MIEVVVLLIALGAGLLARLLQLPPMVGFLLAGFAIAPLQPFYPGLEAVNFTMLADIGVTLLLFSIGLKLDLTSLLRPFVWAVTCLHMAIFITVMCVLFIVIKTLGWALLSDTTLTQQIIIGFALSFSSTVFAVKVLEDRGEMASLHGKAAIGILVMQDIFAVIYLSISSGVEPSVFAPLVLLLIPAKRILVALLKHCGHGELLVLAGFGIAYGGYSLFESLGLKGGLGALFIGTVIAGSSKGNELAKSLLTIKDLLLIGFFLSIGQYGVPNTDTWIMALLLSAVLLIKPILYFILFARFNLRAQTSFFAALVLNHYSEFGLIVMSIAVTGGLLDQQWLIVLALALSLSFVISSGINLLNNKIYPNVHKLLVKCQTSNRVPEQQPIDIGDATILVIGMGRLGTGAYDYLRDTYGEIVVGFDENTQKITEHIKAGRNVLNGDASDRDLWQRIPPKKIKKIILALSNHKETVLVTHMLQEFGFPGIIAAVAKFDDDLQDLKSMGVIAFNFYAGAGAGFAEHVLNHLEKEKAQ